MRPRRVIFLLLDGLRARDAPKLRGAFATLDAGFPSYSKPGYHRMFTGAPSWATGVRSNRFDGHARLPTWLDSLGADVGPTVFVADEVSWLREMFGRPGDASSKGWRTFSRAYDDALRSDAAVVVAHTCVVDYAAHHHGRASAEYRRSVRTATRYALGALRATDPGRDVVAIVSDHGHARSGGHGGTEPDVALAFFFLRGPGIPDGARATGSLEQVAVTLAAALGVPPPGGAVLPPLKPFVPHVKEDTVRRRRTIAALRASIPRDGWRTRTALVATAVVAALAFVARRIGATRTLGESLLAVAPLAGYAALHLATRGPPSLSAIWLENPYQVRMGLFALAAFGGHAAVTRSVPRIAAAAAVAFAPLAASFARLGAGMGSDFADPAWAYVALAGVVPFAVACATLAIAVGTAAVRSRRGGRPRAAAAGPPGAPDPRPPARGPA